MKFKTIVVDPPWDGPGGCPRFEPGKAPAIIPYSCMSGIQIASLRVRELAAGGAQLFLWATSRNLGDAHLLVQDWGFDYRGMFVWLKPGLGLGRHVRNQCEFLLWGAMPGAPLIEPTRCPRQVQTWPNPRRHSEKPPEAYRLIAELSGAPRIDVFARQQRPGYRAWGNEVAA